MRKTIGRILKWTLIPLGCVALFFLLTFLLNAAAEPRDHVSPTYAKADLSPVLAKGALSDEDYDSLYQQTGLGKPAVQDLLLLPDGREKILQAQEDFFREPHITCKQISLTAYQESLTDETGSRIYGFSLAPLRDGDIILTRSMHSFGWRHGHAALITDAAAGQTLEAISLGVDSSYQSVNGWRDWPTVMILRPKAKYGEKAAQAVAFANEHLAGIPYNLVAGIFTSKFQEDISGTQCAHLVWEAYMSAGLDLDSDGGKIVTVKDLANSEYLDVVQVYGVDPDDIWP